MAGTQTGAGTQQPPRASSARARRLLLFRVAGQAYGLPLDAVREVVPMALLARTAALPRVLEGFLNLGGTVVPVLRLDRLFRLPERAPGPYTPLLLLRHADPPLALLADQVSRIVTVAADAVLPVGEAHSFNGCVEGVVTVDSQLVLLLSAERLLLDKEHQCLAELQDREQARLGEWEGTS